MNQLAAVELLPLLDRKLEDISEQWAIQIHLSMRGTVALLLSYGVLASGETSSCSHSYTTPDGDTICLGKSSNSVTYTNFERLEATKPRVWRAPPKPIEEEPVVEDIVIVEEEVVTVEEDVAIVEYVEEYIPTELESNVQVEVPEEELEASEGEVTDLQDNIECGEEIVKIQHRPSFVVEQIYFILVLFSLFGSTLSGLWIHYVPPKRVLQCQRRYDLIGRNIDEILKEQSEKLPKNSKVLSETNLGQKNTVVQNQESEIGNGGNSTETN